MITVIFPAKTLDYCPQEFTDKYTTPEFLGESKTLIAQLKKFSKDEVADPMGISPKLAELNAERYQTWKQPFTT